MVKIEDSVVVPGAPGVEKKVVGTVLYTGQDSYVGEFAPEVPLGTVKRKAMKQFGIEESAADLYALQYEGANQDDKVKIGDLGAKEVTFTLVRVKPQEKGHARSAD
jgi:hypothetical protein